jgi:hypothetical protein
MRVPVGVEEMTSRLNSLSSLFGLRAESLQSFRAHFSDNCLEFLEVSTALRQHDAALMVAAAGEEFSNRCKTYLAEQPVPARWVSRFWKLTVSLEFSYTFLKVEFDADGVSECSHYFHRQIHLDTARSWIADGEGTGADWPTVSNVAAALGTEECNFGTCSSAESRADKVYFFVPLDPDSSARVNEAIRLLPGCWNAWDRLRSLRESLPNRLTVLSLSFQNGKMLPNAQVYLHNVPPGLLGRYAADYREPWPSTELLRKVLVLADQDRLAFVAFRMEQNGELSRKVYVRFSEAQEQRPPGFPGEATV